MSTLLFYLGFGLITIFLISVYSNIREINKLRYKYKKPETAITVKELHTVEELRLFCFTRFSSYSKDVPPAIYFDNNDYKIVSSFISQINHIDKKDKDIVFLLICTIADNSIKYKLIEEFKDRIVLITGKPFYF